MRKPDRFALGMAIASLILATYACHVSNETHQILTAAIAARQR
jgi:hypothetical protein